jgi:hypothetical protein
VVGFWCCLVGFVGFWSGYEVGSSNSSYLVVEVQLTQFLALKIII